MKQSSRNSSLLNLSSRNKQVHGQGSAFSGGLFGSVGDLAKTLPSNNSSAKAIEQPIQPTGDTVDQRLRSMMDSPKYRDPNDTRLFEHVTNEFKRAYPGNAQYDEFGKMIRPKPSTLPQQVRAFDPSGVLRQSGSQHAAYEQAQAGREALEESEDLSDANLNAMGVETTEQMVAKYGISKQEAARQKAAENRLAAQRQTQTGLHALDDADDLSDSDMRMVLNRDNGVPISREALQRVEENARFAHDVRLEMFSGDFARGAQSMNQMDNWAINNPESYKRAGPEARYFHRKYKEFLGGRTSESAKQKAYAEVMNLGARKYSPIAMLDSSRRVVNNMVTGGGSIFGNPVDNQKYEMVYKPTMAEGFAKSEDGKVVYNTTDIVANAATMAGGLPLGIALNLASGAGKGAYQAAKNGEGPTRQQIAAILRGTANAAGSATQVPGLDMVVDAGAEWLINGWNKGKEGDQSQ
jgi:hypothetical protein